jgi:four helix bundle protein
MSENILLEKSYNFALRIVRLSEFLNNEKHEHVLSRKVLDSGTSIGVLVEEGRQGDDRSEFAAKYSIANKEAFKTHYWLRLIRDAGFIGEKQAQSLLDDCDELKKMLIASIRTARARS